MGDIGTKIASDRDLQDEVIAYLADARLRKQSAAVPHSSFPRKREPSFTSVA